MCSLCVCVCVRGEGGNGVLIGNRRLAVGIKPERRSPIEVNHVTG